MDSVGRHTAKPTCNTSFISNMGDLSPNNGEKMGVNSAKLGDEI